MIMHKYCDKKMRLITARSVIRERKFKRVAYHSNRHLKSSVQSREMK